MPIFIVMRYLHENGNDYGLSDASYPNVLSASLAQLGDGGTSGNCTPGNVPTSTFACLIDPALEVATVSTTPKSGYYFQYAQGTGTYTITGAPSALNSTGVRFFFSDQTVVIRAASGVAANASSSPI